MIFRSHRLILVLVATASSLSSVPPAAAQTAEYFDHAAFADVAGDLTVIGFDEVTPAVGALDGSEYQDDGLTIVQRNGYPLNVISINTGFLFEYHPSSVHSLENALSSSFSLTSYWNERTDNIDFIFSEPVSAAGVWVGNTGGGTNSVQFLGPDGAVIASETLSASHPNAITDRIGNSGINYEANNRIFYGLVSDQPIQRIRTVEPGGDFDAITYDDVQFSTLGGGGDETDCSADRTSDELCPGAPVADAGSDQSAIRGVIVSLNGSGSSDPDEGYPIGFEWSLVSKPSGSTAALADANSASPSFTPDAVGDYVIELVVSDSTGILSLPDQVTVSTTNVPPLADAGPDQAVTVIGTVVQLDGSGSYDEDGDAIEYAWSVVGRPAGSTASISGASTATPTFQPDVFGDYVIQLVVTDVLGAPSAADTMMISFDNIAPAADAGENQAVVVGQAVTLDGGGSADANGDGLSYAWSLVELPIGSAATVVDPTAKTTSFTPDLPGEYVASLVVSDGLLESEPVNITVMVVSKEDAASGALVEAVSLINGFDDGAFKNPNMRRALTNKLNAVLGLIERGNTDAAAVKLEQDVMAKTDGCADGGAPDANDWITDCAAQGQLYAKLVEALDLLR